ncbi:uncharacterized protein JCM15063_001950 [Sporobolomyces koalae]|uniref:uncharacterized protein n=1 Tax=Sporobolomyces koalae TaxID=500713 RepID=UPI003178325E
MEQLELDPTAVADGAIGATSAANRRASAVYLASDAAPPSSDPLQQSTILLINRIRPSPACSPTHTPPESPIPSRIGSPASSTTVPRRRAQLPGSSHVPVSLARRLSKPFVDIAVKASTPSVYVDFLVSLHPSLLAYFFVAVSSTISNKSLLRGFFQGITFLLTAWQMACATLGTMLSVKMGHYKPIKLTPKRESIMKMVALVFSLEIAASNLALRLIPVPFHVSVRAAAPILTLFVSLVFFSSTTTLRTSSSLLLVLLGISFTSLNEEWHSLGSLLVILSTFLLTSKSLLTTRLLSDRFHLHPLDILARMSPLSMIHCALFAIANGEVQKLWRFLRSPDFTREHLLEIVLNGVLSFGVVVCGLVAERRTKPPALAITAQAAQATTILVSTLIFDLHLSFVNFVGVAFVLAGGVFYARYEAMDDDEKSLTNDGSRGFGDVTFRDDHLLLPIKVRRDDPIDKKEDKSNWWNGIGSTVQGDPNSTVGRKE